MGHGSLRPLDFDNGVTRIWRDLLARIQDPVCRANEWLGQIHRIIDDADEREIVPVPDPVFGECCPVAARNTIASNPAGL